MKMLLKIIKTAKPWRVHLTLATLMIFAINAVNLVAPMFVRRILNIVQENDLSQQSTIWKLAGILFCLYMVRVAMQFFQNYLAHIGAWNLVARMRANVYAHLQGLSMRYYNDKQTGQLMSRVIEDTANFEVLIAHALPDLITSLFIFVGVLTLLIIMSPTLALLTCIPLPLVLLCSIFVRKMRKHFTQRQKVSAELNSILQDNISGMKEIQIFNRQQFEHERMQDKAQEHANQTVKGIFWVSLMHPVIGFLSTMGTLIVILFGGILALTTDFPSAHITVFLLYLGLLYAPIAGIARVVEDIQTASVSGKRVFEILDTISDVQERENARDFGLLEGNIKFENVSFDYTNDMAILKNVSFSAPQGTMVALVGATGAGKTTITSLMARFYDVQEGSVTIDGIDIRDMTLACLRNQISMVTQDVFLFNGTISQNIAYGRADTVSMQEIEEAAKTADIYDFIMSLPDKFDTKVGERGVRLSGGQKQRLAIARAILRKSPILILDEATSAVDNETEKEIQKAIDALAGKRTILVIAHRLSTVERANQILVLEEGEIAERGTHEELKALGGVYSKMLMPK